MAQAPSAADNAAAKPSVRDRPAHREGKRGALIIASLYCITIPTGIGLAPKSGPEIQPRF